ncbi:NF038132 family protein [Alishewanella sp. HH-ZS]|uniref:NF038132 family protein n=1 Tax=Alishewanella sp. HH-ZS TaxID=1856684 RepID=UPI001C3FFE02
MGIPASWSCQGSCGASSADGVVTLAPNGGSNYAWVSSSGGVVGLSLAGVGGSGSPQNGSVLRFGLFNAGVDDVLSFSFNYITSDCSGYGDCAWARLLDSSANQVALLFTARTTPNGSVVPGFSMPAPSVTLDPLTVPIISGAPVWSPLGSSSGTRFNAGCGYTGWVNTSFSIANTGSYFLEFGVVNWSDNNFQSGLAIDAVTINGTPVGPVSAPFTLLLLSSGLLLLRRRRNPL